jgi:hypothetical protein
MNITVTEDRELGHVQNITTRNYSVVRIPVLYNISSGRNLHVEPTIKFHCSAVGSCDPSAGQGRPAQHYQVPKKSGPHFLVM